jgi:hypothetical protein
VLLETLQKHFESTNAEEKEEIRQQLERAKAMLNDADKDLVQPIFSSFVDQTSLLQYNGGAKLQMKTKWLKSGTIVSESDQRLLLSSRQSS